MTGEVVYAEHDGKLWAYNGCTLTDCTFSTLTTDALKLTVRRRNRWQRLLYRLSTPLRIRLVVTP